MQAVKLVGHRGFPEKYPENSLTGILAAFDAGADGVEIDIQASRDGVPLVFHDDSLERVTGLEGKLKHYDFDVLKMFSAHEPNRFGNQFLPEPLLSLHQLADSLQDYPSKILFVELKEEIFLTHDREVFLARVCQCLDHLSHHVVIMSYDLDVIDIARRVFQTEIGWILDEYSATKLEQAKALLPDILICNHKKLPISGALWPGSWSWFIYDAVDKDMAQNLIDRGVDYIETWDVQGLKSQLELSADTV